MSRQHSDWLLLFALSLSLRLVAAVFIPHPGYMDAAYSYDIALNLTRGAGLSEPFLWNYLDDPAGLPHPSHLYWMPLPTILAWLGMITFGHTYRAAQVLFVVLSALLPLVSYWVALQITHRRFYGWLAGLLTIFTIKVEFFPDTSLDLITITVPYRGASPAEVEEGVCLRVEQAIAGVEGIKRIKSSRNRCCRSRPIRRHTKSPRRHKGRGRQNHHIPTGNRKANHYRTHHTSRSPNRYGLRRRFRKSPQGNRR